MELPSTHRYVNVKSILFQCIEKAALSETLRYDFYVLLQKNPDVRRHHYRGPVIDKTYVCQLLQLFQKRFQRYNVFICCVITSRQMFIFSYVSICFCMCNVIITPRKQVVDVHLISLRRPQTTVHNQLTLQFVRPCAVTTVPQASLPHDEEKHIAQHSTEKNYVQVSSILKKVYHISEHMYF